MRQRLSWRIGIVIIDFLLVVIYTINVHDDPSFSNKLALVIWTMVFGLNGTLLISEIRNNLNNRR